VLLSNGNILKVTALPGMTRQKHRGTGAIGCSFCGKSEAAVGKLISNPGDFRTRVYICDQCITVCAYILNDDTDRSARGPVNIDPQKRHPVLDNPLTALFLRSVESWIKLESSGADSAAEFEELRNLALSLFAPET
jgi:ClpX C4-type zinc finger